MYNYHYNRKLEASDQAKTDDIKRKKLLDKSWEEDKKIINFNVVDNNVHFTYEKEDLFSVLPGRRSFKAFNINVDRIYEQTMNANNFNSLVKPKFNEQQQQQFVDLYLKDNLKAGKMKNNDNNSSISNDNSKSRKDNNNNHNNNNNKNKGKK